MMIICACVSQTTTTNPTDLYEWPFVTRILSLSFVRQSYLSGRHRMEQKLGKPSVRIGLKI